jgi:hypothetical protein
VFTSPPTFLPPPSSPLPYKLNLNSRSQTIEVCLHWNSEHCENSVSPHTPVREGRHKTQGCREHTELHNNPNFTGEMHHTNYKAKRLVDIYERFIQLKIKRLLKCTEFLSYSPYSFLFHYITYTYIGNKLSQIP